MIALFYSSLNRRATSITDVAKMVRIEPPCLGRVIPRSIILSIDVGTAQLAQLAHTLQKTESGLKNLMFHSQCGCTILVGYPFKS